MTFPRYPEYRGSAVEWIGEIPVHWKIDRLKVSIKSCRNGIWGNEANGDAYDIPCVRVADFDRIKLEVKQEIPTIRNVTEKEQASRILKKGDLLIEKSGGGENQPVGCVVLYNKEQKAVCSNFVAKIELATNMDPAYWRYVHSAAYSVRLTIGSINQTSGIQNLDQDRYFNERSAYPPINEQIAIAKFLENETKKIDKLIDEQQKFIVLLNEKRKAVISHTVCKGLDLKVKMKDSGVEWLGQIPETWMVKKIKFVVDVMASNVDKKTYEGDTPCLLCNYTDVYYNDQILKDMEFMSATATPEQIIKFTLKKGDVIITKDSESPDDIAIAAYVPIDLIGVVCGYHLSIIRAFDINGMFVKRLFDSHYLKSKFATLANGLTRYGLGQHSINNVYIPIPPEEEQQRIVDFINKTCNDIDDLIDKSKTSMNLLTERRSALITAAVTGQIDVRNYQLKEIA